MTPAERTDHILRMMLRGEWKGGRSRKELAEEWKLHERTIGDDAMVASGVLARRGKPIEELIDARMAELESIQSRALEHKRAVVVGGELVYVDDPQFIAAIKAIQLQVDIRGVTSTSRKPAADTRQADAEYDKLSAEQRIAMHKAAIAEEEVKLKGVTH